MSLSDTAFGPRIGNFWPPRLPPAQPVGPQFAAPIPVEFKYIEVPDLPQLAWCARVNRGRDAVVLVHGSGVETHPRGFVEGAWDGDFAALNFTDATIVCGTGGRVEDSCIQFTGSTDRLCPLFSIAKGDSVFVSQSPAFVMTMAEEAPNDIYPFYAHDFIRIFRQGLFCPSGKVRLQSGLSLRVHFSTIITIDKQLSTTFRSHRLCEAPKDFQTYKALLVTGVRSVLENADHPARRRRYTPLAVLSRGYDSSAAAALASMAGCKESVSSTDSRREDPHEDSGGSNARYLGMTSTEYDRWEFLNRGREAEFGYFTVSCNAPLAAIEPLLTGRILVTGASGAWNPKFLRASNNLARPYERFLPSVGQLEFRLRVGYQLFAPPAIAFRHHRLLYDISNSEEMRPFSIGGSYDKPLPRRIAEEAGLPREQFGTRKHGTGSTHLTDDRWFSGTSIDDYRRFVRERHASAAAPIRRYWWARTRWRRFLWSRLGGRRVVPSSVWQRRFPFMLNAKPIDIPYDFLFVFQWATAVMRERYSVARGENVRTVAGRWDNRHVA